MIKKLLALSVSAMLFSTAFTLFAQNDSETQLYLSQGYSLEEIEEAELRAASTANVSKAKSQISSSSRVDWVSGSFISDVSMDVAKAGIPMPSGKSLAVNRIQMELPVLIKDPLLSLYVDDTRTLEDMILEGSFTFEDISRIIDTSKRTPAYFAKGSNNLKFTNTINLAEVGALLVKHHAPYVQEKPIERIASRAYTGIIIDARGTLPVQGEHTSSKVSPCLFPRIWDENMTLVYERNMVDPQIAKKSGIVEYTKETGNNVRYERTGKSPLWIIAKKVYGVNRCDPVITYEDYLRIATIPENRELLKEGKVVILLDDKELNHAVKAAERNTRYYLDYPKIQKQLEKVPGLEVNDVPSGLEITMSDLRFIADSTALLPEEKPRVSVIANQIKEALLKNPGEYTITVEGHTADVNKPEGQMTLSIQRAQAVVQALIQDGIDSSLFTYKGYGGTLPLMSNSTPEGRAANRRVVIKLMPKSTGEQRR